VDLGSLVRPWIEIAYRLHWSGILAGTQGSLSQRFEEGGRTDDGEMVYPGCWLVTARGTHKATLGPADFCLMSAEGEVMAGDEPSLDWEMHLGVYRFRPEVHAVIHAQPAYCTALAVAGVALPGDMLVDLAVDIAREIPLVPFAVPGTPALGQALQTYLGHAHAALLEQDGAIALGSEPHQAADRMERLERAAQVYVAARLLAGGPPRTIGTADVAAARTAAGQPGE
jgi:L-fuculose-phosphate aldolase